MTTTVNIKVRPRLARADRGRQRSKLSVFEGPTARLGDVVRLSWHAEVPVSEHFLEFYLLPRVAQASRIELRGGRHWQRRTVVRFLSDLGLNATDDHGKSNTPSIVVPNL